MPETITVTSEQEYAAAQQRVEELQASEKPADHEQLAALAEAMLAWELRLEGSQE